MKIRYTAFSETGLRMEENQDSLFCATNGPRGLFVVADGMGGHEDGARASRTIKEKASAWWNKCQSLKNPSDFVHTVQELKEVFSDANREIYCNTDKNSICGSTLAALWIADGAWTVFSCGDSRCYQAQRRIFKHNFFQLTTDDVWENQAENIYGMTSQEIQSNKNYGALVRAVGVRPNFQCSIQSDNCKAQALFLLCSDGIYKYCPKQILRNSSFLALRTGKLETAAKTIRTQVLNSGAGDNLSLALILVEN